MTDLGRYLGREEPPTALRGLKEETVRPLGAADWGDIAVTLAPFSSTDDLPAFCNVPLVRRACVTVACEIGATVFVEPSTSVSRGLLGLPIPMVLARRAAISLEPMLEVDALRDGSFFEGGALTSFPSLWMTSTKALPTEARFKE